MNNDKKIVVRCRAIIVHDDKLLVVKHPHDESRAVLPGGHLEWGEDVKTCLLREIKEELDTVAEIGKLLFINSFVNNENVHTIEFLFEVTNSQDFFNKEFSLHLPEISSVAWVDKNTDVSILPKRIDALFRQGNLKSGEIEYLKD